MEELLIRLVLASVAVFGALGIFVFLLRRYGGQTLIKKLNMRKTSTMSIEGVLNAGNRRQFILLKHQGQEKEYLILSTPQNSLLIDSFKAKTDKASEK